MANESSNLTLHRGGQNVWDRQDHEHLRARVMGAVGLGLIAAGTALLAQAYRSELTTAMRAGVAALPRRMRIDIINEAAEESFPASDPPSWNSGSDGKSPARE